MSIAFVLGNGLSRSGLDLERLRCCGSVYGCNALYRDFIPDVLVSTDRPISTAIQESKYAIKNQFYTRNPILGQGAHVIPEPYWKYSSGPAAVALAAEQGNNLIYMIGFDMGPTSSNQFNNVYADTEFYKKATSVPTYTGNWVNQIEEIVKKFRDKKFVRVVGNTTAQVKKLENIPNLLHLPICEFLENV